MMVTSGPAGVDPAQDTCLTNVFERADSRMHENKASLKGPWIPSGDSVCS
ncbi:MAG: hypothetical protein IJ189_06510 [Clostridia bacterium]|nr:hypothetical protein [Clostridia bacterium]